MLETMREEVRRFQAVAEDGTEYTVVEWLSFAVSQPLSGPRRRRPGSKDWTLAKARGSTRSTIGPIRSFKPTRSFVWSRCALHSLDASRLRSTTRSKLLASMITSMASAGSSKFASR